MRINKYLAQATGMSRRDADKAIEQGRVLADGQPAHTGQDVPDGILVTLDGASLNPPEHTQTIVLNKPVGYVVSRDGQGSKTIYDLLPPQLHHLKPVGRLDKDSSGLLLLTNDGQLAQQLTHPRHQKTKIYEVTLNKPLRAEHAKQISQQGIRLEDGISKLQLKPLDKTGKAWQVTMQEGRNRQIRRTFATLGYTIKKLHRTRFGNHPINTLASAEYHQI